MFLITGWNVWNPIPRECVFLKKLPGPEPAVFYHRLAGYFFIHSNALSPGSSFSGHSYNKRPVLVNNIDVRKPGLL